MFEIRLKQLREDKDLLQKELGDILGVTSQTISGWEIGRTKPDYDMLVKIAKYFNVSVDYLLGNVSKNSEKDEMGYLKQLLIKNGYMKPNEDLSKEELERLMKFVKNNKEFIKNTK